MEMFNIDLTQIAREDNKTIEATKRAFAEAIRLARREVEDAPVDAVVMRIINLRKTFKCSLTRAVLLWDAQSDLGYQSPKPRKCKVCGKATAPSSYYFCVAHLHQVNHTEHNHADFIQFGNA